MLKPCGGLVRAANLCLRPTYAGYCLAPYNGTRLKLAQKLKYLITMFLYRPHSRISA